MLMPAGLSPRAGPAGCVLTAQRVPKRNKRCSEPLGCPGLAQGVCSVLSPQPWLQGVCESHRLSSTPRPESGVRAEERDTFLKPPKHRILMEIGNYLANYWQLFGHSK